MWAIGLMYYAMLFGELPFWGETEDQLIHNISTKAIKFNKRVPVTDECKEIIKMMMEKDPEKRI